MRQSFHIFKEDAARLRRNVIAWVVILGISVVPSLYAWFNIAGSWDPYTSTQGLKVAVASEDSGYTGKLVAVSLNLGDQVVDTLKANEELDWVFTDADTAKDGVSKGDYYAALVIPEDFSRNMMSLFSDHVEKSAILYYNNEKENAIAPKVTDEGASTLQRQINETFIKTVSGIALDGLKSFYQAAEKTDTQTLSANLQQNLMTLSADAGAASDTVKAFASLTGSAGQVVQTTNAFLNDAGTRASAGRDVLRNADQAVTSMQDAYTTALDGVDAAFTQSQAYYDKVSAAVDDGFAAIGSDASAVSANLKDQAANVQTVIDRYMAFKDDLEAVNAVLPGKPLDGIIQKVGDSIDRQTALRDNLTSTASDIVNTVNHTEEAHQSLKKAADDSAAAFGDLHEAFTTTVRPQTDALFTDLKDTAGQTLGLIDRLSGSTGSVTAVADDTVETLDAARKNLETVAAHLDTARDQLAQMAETVKQGNSPELVAVENILSGDTEGISSFLAAPVRLETQKVYPVDNYGSAMAPFYTTLAIWVGGVILVAMVKTEVSTESARASSLSAQYFGRYLSFLLIGLIQATIVCLGDLWVLGIQCEHPLLFVLAGWVSSLVYVNIMYTLTLSFGDIGKAIAVVIMVLQVAGSGGTFPVEVLPSFFGRLYPLMPFAHSMAAMRECIAGMYGATYWIELLKLMAFMVPSLLLGLVLRKPVIRLNHAFMEKLEETKLI